MLQLLYLTLDRDGRAWKGFDFVVNGPPVREGVHRESRERAVAGGGVVIVNWPGRPLNFEPKRAWILNMYVEPQQKRGSLARRHCPVDSFCYYQHGQRTVHPDGCVKVEAAYYSTLPGWIGHRD